MMKIEEKGEWAGQRRKEVLEGVCIFNSKVFMLRFNTTFQPSQTGTEFEFNDIHIFSKLESTNKRRVHHESLKLVQLDF